jgi:hypothetical protein
MNYSGQEPPILWASGKYKYMEREKHDYCPTGHETKNNYVGDGQQ